MEVLAALAQQRLLEPPVRMETSAALAHTTTTMAVVVAITTTAIAAALVELITLCPLQPTPPRSA